MYYTHYIYIYSLYHIYKYSLYQTYIYIYIHIHIRTGLRSPPGVPSGRWARAPPPRLPWLPRGNHPRGCRAPATAFAGTADIYIYIYIYIFLSLSLPLSLSIYIYICIDINVSLRPAPRSPEIQAELSKTVRSVSICSATASKFYPSRGGCEDTVSVEDVWISADLLDKTDGMRIPKLCEQFVHTVATLIAMIRRYQLQIYHLCTMRWT